MTTARSAIFQYALCLLLGGTMLSAQVPVENSQKPVVPLAPAELIKFLPAIPPPWQLTSSTASNYFSDWVTSVAERKFKAPSSHGTGEGRAAPPFMLLSVRISDTGGWQGFTAEFRHPPGAAGALQVNGMPALKFSTGESAETLRYLVNDRFIVQIATENQPLNAAEGWAKRLDLSRLGRIKATGPAAIPRPLIISRIDELNPKNNRSYPLHWMTGEEVDTEARRDVSP